MEANKVEEKIIREARRLFIEKGYAGTSMSEIAQSCGLTRPALHYYFRTKDKLFQAVYVCIITEFVPHVEEIVLADEPVQKRVEMLVDTYVDQLSRNPSLPLFIVMEANRDAEHLIRVFIDLGLRQYFTRVSTHLRKEMETGTIRRMPIHIIVFTFYGYLLVPFMFRNVLSPVITSVEDNYLALMQEMKPYIVSQMVSLLCG